MPFGQKIHPLGLSTVLPQRDVNRQQHQWERDSDCSSSIHSRPGLSPRNTAVSSQYSARSEEKDNASDIASVLYASTASFGLEGSRKVHMTHSEIRDRIVQDVINEVLPDIGHFADGDVRLQQFDDGGFTMKWLKFFGCVAMDLHDAVISGTTNDVRKSVAKLCTGTNARPEKINEIDSRGRTALSLAAQIGKMEMCAELYDHNADIECPDEENGRTPLFHSVQFKHHELSKFLLARGARANVSDLQSVTPLMIACTTDDHRHVQMLCAAHADVDLQDERGWTALHYAVTHNAHRCVQLLLDEGANRELRDLNKRKPMHFAKFHDYGNIIAILAEKSKMAL